MSLLNRFNQTEIQLCLAFNRMNQQPRISQFFGIISRLGDGLFWYLIMLALPLIHGQEAWLASIHMMVVGLVSLPIYKLLKTTTVRHRPFRHTPKIHQNVPPLDQFSFPSGHTMHAVGFSIALLVHYPIWALLVLPFTLLVALSRLVLGLHYPSDVVAGALIGALIASLSLVLF